MEVQDPGSSTQDGEKRRYWTQFGGRVKGLGHELYGEREWWEKDKSQEWLLVFTLSGCWDSIIDTGNTGEEVYLEGKIKGFSFGFILFGVLWASWMWVLFVCLLCFLFFWLHCAACGILVPRPGIEPGPSAVKARSPNLWTAREFTECVD